MSKILSFQHIIKKFLKTNDILPSFLCTQSVKSALYCTMKAHLKLDQTHVKGSTATSGLCSGENAPPHLPPLVRVSRGGPSDECVRFCSPASV